jgi:hypothetical protein
VRLEQTLDSPVAATALLARICDGDHLHILNIESAPGAPCSIRSLLEPDRARLVSRLFWRV